MRIMPSKTAPKLNRKTKVGYVQAGAEALCKSLIDAGCVISSNNVIAVTRNALGIYLLGAVDYLVKECGYQARFTKINPPQEFALTTSVRTLRTKQARKKVSV